MQTAVLDIIMRRLKALAVMLFIAAACWSLYGMITRKPDNAVCFVTIDNMLCRVENRALLSMKEKGLKAAWYW